MCQIFFGGHELGVERSKIGNDLFCFRSGGFVEPCHGIGQVNDLTASVNGGQYGREHAAFCHDTGNHKTAGFFCGFHNLRDSKRGIDVFCMLAKVGYAEIWPLFGSANQLLSVLALIACAVFLKRTKRQGAMLWIPMVFMMAVTFTALGMTIFKLGNAFITTGLSLGNTLQLIFAVLLLILGVIVAVQGIKKLFERNSGAVKA